MIITGLCGVGKIVLLDVFREKAEGRGWATVEWEIEKKAPFGPKVAAQARKALRSSSRGGRRGAARRSSSSPTPGFLRSPSSPVTC